MMTTINRSYKIRCYLSPAQEDLFAKTQGCCRYVYNRVAQEAESLPATGWPVGVDVGVKTLAALSTGEKVAAAKKLKKLHRQLKHQQRILSCRKGSRKGEAQASRYRRQRRKLARIHCRIAGTRADGIHLTGDFDVIAREDLNVKGMSSAKDTAEQPGKRVAQNEARTKRGHDIARMDRVAA